MLAASMGYLSALYVDRIYQFVTSETNISFVLCVLLMRRTICGTD
jgi:hypothetical protein